MSKYNQMLPLLSYENIQGSSAQISEYWIAEIHFIYQSIIFGM